MVGAASSGMGESSGALPVGQGAAAAAAKRLGTNRHILLRSDIWTGPTLSLTIRQLLSTNPLTHHKHTFYQTPQTLSQPIISTHPFNSYHINPPSQPNLSTHPLNPPSHHLSYHLPTASSSSSSLGGRIGSMLSSSPQKATGQGLGSGLGSGSGLGLGSSTGMMMLPSTSTSSNDGSGYKSFGPGPGVGVGVGLEAGSRCVIELQVNTKDNDNGMEAADSTGTRASNSGWSSVGWGILALASAGDPPS